MSRGWATGNSPLAFGTGITAVSTKKLRYVDMNVASGGIARDTIVPATWTDLFSYSGSGLLYSFLANLDTLANMEIRLVVDSEEIFSSVGIIGDDVVATPKYAYSDQGEWSQGIRREHHVFHWRGPLQFPMEYSISVEVKVQQPAGNKLFKAGLVVLTKET